jgi:cobalt-precorrin-7 (C5)-methyltransferase
VIVVGVGCAPGLLTQEAIGILSKCDRVYGARRALSMIGPCLPPGCEEVELRDFSTLDALPEDAVVLSTGDPMLGGLGRPGVKVVPGISSLQIACARLGVPWERVAVVTAHHGPAEEAMDRAGEEIARGRTVFMLTAPGFDIAALTVRLAARSIKCRIAVLEELGYPEEWIAMGTTVSPPNPRSRLFSLLVGEW